MKRFFIASFMGIVVLFLLSSCSLEENITAKSQQSKTTEQSSIEESDGIQEVTLSWGKFNYNVFNHLLFLI